MVTKSGVTIPPRDATRFDGGEIMAQTRVPVLEGDTPETLAARVLEREHSFLQEVLGEICCKNEEMK